MYCLKQYLTTMGMLSVAAAACKLPGGAVPPGTFAESAALCIPQGEGYWTFALSISAIEVPTFSGEDPNAGFSGDSSYYIYDHTCELKSTYGTNADDCDIPFTIEENFLQDVLTVTSQDTMIGGGSFSFIYGDGKFTIGNNGCTCQDMSDGLRAGQGCKCAFPVDGTV